MKINNLSKFTPIFLGIGFWITSAASAEAHGGIEPGRNLLLAWNTNPLPSLGLFLAAYIYINGLNRWSHPSHPISQWQRISFFSGLIVIFLALQSPIDPLAEHQFSIHQVQHLLLRMIGPLLVLSGAPLTPMLRGAPPWFLQVVIKPIVRVSVSHQIYGFITNPVLTTLVFIATIYLWQIPAVHDMAVRSDLVHSGMHSTMLISGFMFWWLVIDPKPHRSRLHFALRILYLGLIVIPNTILGASITFSSHLLYEAYQEFPQPLGLSPLIDQQLGGLILWVVGDMMSILAAGIVMILWYKKEQDQTNASVL
ncbi:MAG: cytochrome c oxidase assembly protein [Chloroflexota bacterium]|nr:cytochrome c oxidase assembly protein [Chloroflexota bacterium]